MVNKSKKSVSPLQTNAAPARQTRSRKAKAEKIEKQENVEKRDVEWRPPANHHLTDSLLTAVEASSTYKQAFGFDKGPNGTPVSGVGKNSTQLYRQLARTIFFNNQRITEEYVDEDLDRLSTCIKNRVANLKKIYRKQRQMLSETGQGLIDDDREHEITPGSTLQNIWDKIQTAFPWYKRMNILMGASPIVDRSAIAHSGTKLDLSALGSYAKRSITQGSSSDIDGGGGEDTGNGDGTGDGDNVSESGGDAGGRYDTSDGHGESNGTGDRHLAGGGYVAGDSYDTNNGYVVGGGYDTNGGYVLGDVYSVGRGYGADDGYTLSGGYGTGSGNDPGDTGAAAFADKDIPTPSARHRSFRRSSGDSSSYSGHPGSEISSITDSHVGSPHLDNVLSSPTTSKPQDQKQIETAVLLAPGVNSNSGSAKRKSDELDTTTGKLEDAQSKRKKENNPFDRLDKISEAEHRVRIELNQQKNRFEAEESEHRRRHELQMMQAQIELARIQHGLSSSSVNNPALGSDPAIFMEYSE
ncbi:hypothetical protein PUNSTDRAFT_131787 [Punctularia strigosozonata HHB-11173 SS5]|uniref:uncharacterized protein n=1 Tax=Punctularia strigosozonata (strain HHB-11173) TaxID=741275 RepID=UPI0004416BFE|nr:uncharacterized protein PUNSTDRAFT_131787 [Punctularia strigosozonata HHB-11173 SS5]EIN11627.1 hypothetical protein PUNSTDRAFT_131787 [Punctularia strigosozonata HHB-11173 SS5]